MSLIKKGTKVPKKLIQLCIIDILESASESRPLTQDAIRDRLENEYGIAVDRKTVRENLKPLVENIERIRLRWGSKISNGKETGIMTDLWMQDAEDGLFEDVELQVLIYSVIFSKHLRSRFKKDLVRKLESLSKSGIDGKIDCCIYENEDTSSVINELEYNIDILSEAISDKKMVSFEYESYEADMRLRTETRIFTVSPLGIGIRDDDFCLLAVVNGVENDSTADMLSHLEDVIKAMEDKQVHVNAFRMDRIRGIEILDEGREELNTPKSLRLRGAHNDSFNIQEYLRENPSLSTGRTIIAEFRLTEGKGCSLSDVVDHFGETNMRETRKVSEGGREPAVYSIKVRTNSGAMRDYALRHAESIEVTGPEDLRQGLLDTFHTALARMQAAAGDMKRQG